jgi:hypothetical protein
MTIWTLPVPDSTIDTAVLADPLFTTTEGTVLLVGNSGGIYVYAFGNYTAGCAIVGRSYSSYIELSQMFVRDQDQAVIEGQLQIGDIRVQHRNTGKYKIEVDYDAANKTTATTTFEADDDDIQIDGNQEAGVLADSDSVTIKIKGDGPKPFTVSTVHAECDFTDN